LLFVACFPRKELVNDKNETFSTPTYVCTCLHLQCAVFIGELFMRLDIEKYLHYMDDLDLSQDQKEAYIRTIWGIMESSTDKEFKLHPVQQHDQSLAHKGLQIPAQRIDSKKPSIGNHFKNAAICAQEDCEDQ